MKVVFVPGLEEAIKKYVEAYGIPVEDGKLPEGYIPDTVALKTDLEGFLKALPAATTNSLGGIKLYSNTSPQVADRTYGAMCNDQGGYLRTMPARLGGGLHWAGVVNVYSDFNADLNYAFSDVYGASAVNQLYTSLKNRLDGHDTNFQKLDELLDEINGVII